MHHPFHHTISILPRGLVILDDSRSSKQALKYALATFSDFLSEIVIVYVSSSPKKAQEELYRELPLISKRISESPEVHYVSNLEDWLNSHRTEESDTVLICKSCYEANKDTLISHKLSLLFLPELNESKMIKKIALPLTSSTLPDYFLNMLKRYQVSFDFVIELLLMSKSISASHEKEIMLKITQNLLDFDITQFKFNSRNGIHQGKDIMDFVKEVRADLLVIFDGYDQLTKDDLIKITSNSDGLNIPIWTFALNNHVRKNAPVSRSLKVIH